MMGMVSVGTDDGGALRGAMLLINLIEMLADPQRQALVAQLTQLADRIKEYEAIRAECENREKSLIHRGRDIDAAAEALAKERADLTEERQQARAELQRVEEKTAELEQLKTELRGWVKAAA
jgi:hypothetical protein